jgi:protoporphyrinogen oxidase
MKSVYIVGAGISGLIAAIELEKKGFSPIVIEASDRVGGRLKTDTIEDFPLDHSFQVLLEAYPMVKTYLDLKVLNLQKLVPGALIYTEKGKMLIGDPLRDFSLFFPTLFAKVGSFGDKLKIFKLNLELKNKSIDAIFSSENITTKTYLESKGFSAKIIETFFKPFFTGIFLETELETSSIMFQFIYKMFGEGLAVIPENGIEAIPKQLQAQLKQSTFKFNTKVTAIDNGLISLENGITLETDYTVLATNTNLLADQNKTIKWKSCHNVYFEIEHNPIKKPVIGLVASKEALINNIYVLNSDKKQKQDIKQIISVTVVKNHNLSELDLIEVVKKELKTICGITVKRFIKHYHIKKALPDLKTVKHTSDCTHFKETDTVFTIGDATLNGSLNAAMRSGQLVANCIYEAAK